MVVTHTLCHVDGNWAQESGIIAPSTRGLALAKPHPVLTGWAWGGLCMWGQLAGVGAW